ncbi:MAG: beta-propeller domain-containing protein [Acidimicrobiales bacterium]
MHDDIEGQLERLASRGEARGAGHVWSAARTQGAAPGGRGLWPVGMAAVVVAAAIVAGGVTITADDATPPDPVAAGPSSPTTRGAPQIVIAQNASTLVRFDDCAAVLAELKAEALERVGPYGLDRPFFLLGGGDVAQGAFQRTDAQEQSGGGAPPAPDSSQTNTQEVGVDEPDLVETDGRRLYDVRGGTLRVTDVETAVLTATVPLGLVNVDGAVLVEDALVVFANEPLSSGRGGNGGEAKVVVVDVSGTPMVGERLTVDGFLVDVRAVDGRVHVVTVSSPTLAFTYPTGGEAGAEESATEANKARIRSSTLADWLPSRTVTAADGATVGERAQLTDCDEIRRPATFAGFEQTTLVTLDLGDLSASPATSVQASSLLVYGSAESIYTATTSYADLRPGDEGGAVDNQPRTALHRFRLGPEPAYAGSGQVEGYVREQFGLSEHEGGLRVASSTVEGGARSRITVLRVDEGELVPTGIVDGLGPNEQIEGVRFVGDLGYVVTFRQTDPLYVVDLRDPANPRLAGELKIPGYSRYLHPVGDGYVLGVGHDGTEDGRLTGAAVSLFDVRDPAVPARVDLEAYGPLTGPKIDLDHKAFMWWPERSTAFIPIGVIGSSARVEVVQVVEGTLTRVGAVVPAGEGSPITADFDRVVRVGNRLLSVSPEGVQVSDASTLAPIAWVSYR